MKFIILTHLCLSVPPIFVMKNPSSHVGTCICIVSYISTSRSGRETRCSRCNLKSRLKSCFNNRHIMKLFYERSGSWFTGYRVFARSEKPQNTIHDIDGNFKVRTRMLRCVLSKCYLALCKNCVTHCVKYYLYFLTIIYDGIHKSPFSLSLSHSILD